MSKGKFLKEKVVKYREVVIVLTHSEEGLIADIQSEGVANITINQNLVRISRNNPNKTAKTLLKDRYVSYGEMKIVLSQSTSGTFVTIATEKGIIKENGNTIWEPYMHERYSWVPSEMKQYVASTNPEYVDSEKDHLSVDTWILKESIMFIFPHKRNGKVSVRFDFIDLSLFVDDIHNLDMPKEEQEQIIAEYTSLYEEIDKLSQSFKMNMAYSHKANDWVDAWYDFSFYPKDWSQENFLKLIDKVHNFNKKYNALGKSLGMF